MFRKPVILITIVLLLAALALSASQSKRLNHPAIVQSHVRVSMAHDSFTDVDGTLLENHTLDTGQHYRRVGYSAGGKNVIFGNRATHWSADGFRSIYLADVALGQDQFAQKTVTIQDNVITQIIVRADPNSESYIAAEYNPDNQVWSVYANEGYSGETPLVYPIGSFAETLHPGDVRHVALEAFDDEISFFEEGSLRVFGETYYVAHGGYAGFSLSRKSSAAGTSIDDLDVGNLVDSSSPTPTPTPSASPSPTSSPSPTPTPTASPSPTPSTVQYETRRFAAQDDIDAQLLQLGAQGWLCTGEVQMKLVCSRPIH